ncbi:MAG: hypothetical protein HRT81_08770 [Henriciella sp.]|nr:hypothetical protein [Henriciella sp.]
MIKHLFAGLLVCLIPSATNAQSAPSAPEAQFILQVSSNLDCDTLNVELRSVSGEHTGKLVYSSNAFSAASLPAGTYQFGQVTCFDGPNGTQAFDALKTMSGPFQLQPGHAYLSGKLVVMQTEDTAVQTLPDVVDNCVRGTSRFRKEPRDDCRDGTGIKGDRKTASAVNFYAPLLTPDEIASIRSAFSATEEQLIYLPLRTG